MNMLELWGIILQLGAGIIFGLPYLLSQSFFQRIDDGLRKGLDIVVSKGRFMLVFILFVGVMTPFAYLVWAVFQTELSEYAWYDKIFMILYYGAPGLDAGVTYRNVSPTLVHHCTEEQKRKYLPPLAGGDVIWCQGFSEPDAGSDLAGLKTWAIEEGDYFIINGQKAWASMGYVADWGILLVRTDLDAPKHQGITMFIVDMKAPGVIKNPVKNLLGRTVWGEIFLDGVRIPKENMVGAKNQGWQVAVSTLNTERSGMHWLGTSRRSLDRIVNYVKKNESLAKNPLIRHKLAELTIDVEVARLFCYYVEWLREQGQAPIHEASMAKEYTADLSVRVADACFQILGLYGQLGVGSKWTPLGGTVMEAFLGYTPWAIAGGSPEIQKNIIATMGLGLPR